MLDWLDRGFLALMKGMYEYPAVAGAGLPASGADWRLKVHGPEEILVSLLLHPLAVPSLSLFPPFLPPLLYLSLNINSELMKQPSISKKMKVV